jgi:hypothetical protein
VLLASRLEVLKWGKKNGLVFDRLETYSVRVELAQSL